MTDRTARYAAAIENLTAAAESGAEVYNVDFTDWKDAANRAFEMASRAVQQIHLDGDRENKSDTTLYYEMPYGLHNFPSKKFQGLVAKADDTPVRAAALALIAEWKPVADAIKTVKANVIKGRKPSTTPRMTPERTIENTGTCAICGKNVKLKDGKVVNHGYTVRYGFFEGGCFGVGYEPIETSPAALHDYMSALVGHKDRIIGLNNDESIAFIIAKMDEKTRAKRASQPDAIKAGFERDLRMLTADIEMFGKMINEWTARPLPDAA